MVVRKAFFLFLEKNTQKKHPKKIKNTQNKNTQKNTQIKTPILKNWEQNTQIKTHKKTQKKY